MTLANDDDDGGVNAPPGHPLARKYHKDDYPESMHSTVVYQFNFWRDDNGAVNYSVWEKGPNGEERLAVWDGYGWLEVVL